MPWIDLKCAFLFILVEIKNKGYVSHVLCHLSPVTCHLTTTLCSFSCYDIPMKFGELAQGRSVIDRLKIYRYKKKKSYLNILGKNLLI